MLRAQRTLLIAIAIGALSASTAQADDVYKWTDKNGVSHYADAPPDGTKYEKLSVSRGASRRAEEPAAENGEAADGSEVAQSGTVGASTSCVQARSNLDILNNNPVVRKDTDGDGVLENISGEQRQAEIDRAQRLVDIYCA
jgi:hypothetical protein